MPYGAVQANSTRVGTCPHGLPLGACPICNGMSGGGMRKADFSAKPGEMSWNECAAIGAFLKARQNAKLQRQQDAQNFTQQAIAFQNAMANASQKASAIARFFAANTPPIIAKPVTFVLNTVLGSVFTAVKNFPMVIRNTFQTLGQKLADISDKLAAVYGEIKTAIDKKVSETLNELKKKVKSLFSIFNPQNADDEEKQIDETKKAFKLRTFLHDLYKKLKNEKDLETDEH